MSGKLIKILGLACSLLCATIAFAETGGDLNLTNRASLVSRTGYKLTLGTESTNDFEVVQNGTKTLSINGSTGAASVTGTLTVGGLSATSPTISGNITFSSAAAKLIPGATSFTFRNNADAADNIVIADAGGITLRDSVTFSVTDKGFFVSGTDKRLLLYGGGTATNSHASLALNGSTYSGAVGNVDLVSGAVHGSKITIAAANATSVINFDVGAYGTNRWQIDSSGNFVQNATNGGAHVFNLSSGLTRQGTSDGTDNKYIALCGGGAESNTRGACIQIYGNESNNGTVDIQSGGSTSALIRQYVNGSLKWTVNNTGELLGGGTASIGWAVVDGTDNTACTSQCTAPAVFGFNLAAGATAPVIVGPSDATADICLCAGAS